MVFIEELGKVALIVPVRMLFCSALNSVTLATVTVLH